MSAETLREKMAALPEPVTDKQPPFWEYWRWQLWKHVTIGNDPRRFFDWPEIYHTMLWKHRPDAIEKERQEIIKNGNGWIDTTWAARDPGFVYPGDYQPNTYTSQSLLHQLYHLMRFEQVTGLHVKNMRKITELGGGFGAMALVCQRLGFEGKYALYDLPEFLLLQEYYLSNVGVNNVKFYNNYGAVSRQHGRADLLIACYSLSEMPIGWRNTVMPFLPANNILLLYSNKFGEYDNVDYFKYYAKLHDDMNWHHEQIAHLPEGNWYSFGWEKT